MINRIEGVCWSCGEQIKTHPAFYSVCSECYRLGFRHENARQVVEFKNKRIKELENQLSFSSDGLIDSLIRITADWGEDKEVYGKDTCLGSLDEIRKDFREILRSSEPVKEGEEK